MVTIARRMLDSPARRRDHMFRQLRIEAAICTGGAEEAEVKCHRARNAAMTAVACVGALA
jgi:hypothetical protein